MVGTNRFICSICIDDIFAELLQFFTIYTTEGCTNRCTINDNISSGSKCTTLRKSTGEISFILIKITIFTQSRIDNHSDSGVIRRSEVVISRKRKSQSIFINQFVFYKFLCRNGRFSQNFLQLIFHFGTRFLIEYFEGCNLTVNLNIFSDDIDLRILVNGESSDFFLNLSEETADQNQSRTIIVWNHSVLKIHSMI